MFDFLKKKLSGFTEKLKEKISEKAEEPQTKQIKEEIKEEESQPKIAEEEIKTEEQKQEVEAKQEVKEQSKTKIHKTTKESIQTESLEETDSETKQETETQESEPKIPETKNETYSTEEQKSETSKTTKEIPEKEETVTEQIIEEEPIDEKLVEEKQVAKEKVAEPIQKPAEEKIKEIKQDEKRELKAKLGLTKKLTGFFSGKIKITESEIGDFFDELELSLLEADVQQETAEAIVKEMKERMIGKEISARDNIEEFLKKTVKEALTEIMRTKKVDVLSFEKKPMKILFLGPNGAGKTTSIAKVANYLMGKGKTVVLAAGDTFRAASIEQLEAHAKKLNTKIVKHNYGSDPAAVAFDAIKAAEAKGSDYVLIDTAGRQETNRNLIEELKKIERVAKPDLKLFVSEAYTGQALLHQAEEFDKAIGIDGFILTKIDTDTKGGTAISLLYKLKKPIVFVGTGQEYKDLLEFKPEFIIDRIV